jgi:hypothetical protein
VARRQFTAIGLGRPARRSRIAPGRAARRPQPRRIYARRSCRLPARLLRRANPSKIAAKGAVPATTGSRSGSRSSCAEDPAKPRQAEGTPQGRAKLMKENPYPAPPLAKLGSSKEGAGQGFFRSSSSTRRSLIPIRAVSALWAWFQLLVEAEGTAKRRRWPIGVARGGWQATAAPQDRAIQGYYANDHSGDARLYAKARREGPQPRTTRAGVIDPPCPGAHGREARSRIGDRAVAPAARWLMSRDVRLARSTIRRRPA